MSMWSGSQTQIRYAPIWPSRLESIGGVYIWLGKLCEAGTAGKHEVWVTDRKGDRDGSMSSTKLRFSSSCPSTKKIYTKEK